MTYSRKGLWMVRGILLLLMAAWIWYGMVVRPSRDILPWAGVVFLLAVFALAFRAYFYLDEIQQGDRMRAWYYGSPLGIAVSGMVILYLVANPAFLEVLANVFRRHPPHKPMDYFVAGVLCTMLPQAVGNYVARAVMALAKRDA
jgi:hypothetical protein